jgi:hypothetical protein
MRRYLAEGKLNTSAKMLAVLGYFCDLELTDPVIESLCLTDGADVLASAKDSGRLLFISSAQDLRSNLMGACNALAVPEEECRMLARSADQALGEIKPAASNPSGRSAYAIGCSMWSFKEEPSRDGVRFCPRKLL